MSSSRKLVEDEDDDEYEWSDFELHTLLCLLCKGMHLSHPKKRADDPRTAKRHAYLNVATELNKALHGNSFEKDIPQVEVTQKIDEILAAKGFANYLSRSRVGKITRSMRIVFQRRPLLSFDGSIFEWEHGRKAVEMEKEQEKRLARGVAMSIDPEMTHNKRSSQTGSYNQTRTPAQYPDSVSYDDPVGRAVSFGSGATWLPPLSTSNYQQPAQLNNAHPAPMVSSHLRLPSTQATSSTTAAEAADRFFEEMDREIALQPSLASTNYMSSTRHKMIDATANAEDNVVPGREEAQTVPRGGNSVLLPFNRLHQN
ncbi:hypothetical protein PVAG01_04320 [Phlyctema vagabunda]|uniref:Uncharacterized protein n=1 Tax=Phlyctema vagabunda TaxID=108571 RepID=A0ABR4PNX0_9HELO